MDKINRIIKKVLSKTRSQNIKRQMEIWIDYLNENLIFPFEAIVLGDDITGEVKEGDIVVVNNSIYAYSEEGGIIVSSIHKGNYAYFELIDLEVRDRKSHNYYLVEAYRKWFI